MRIDEETAKRFSELNTFLEHNMNTFDDVNDFELSEEECSELACKILNGVESE